MTNIPAIQHLPSQTRPAVDQVFIKRYYGVDNALFQFLIIL